MVKGMIDSETSSSLVPFCEIAREKAGGEWAVRVVGYVVSAQKRKDFVLHAACDDVVLALVNRRFHTTIGRCRVKESLQLVWLKADYAELRAVRALGRIAVIGLSHLFEQALPVTYIQAASLFFKGCTNIELMTVEGIKLGDIGFSVHRRAIEEQWGFR